MSYQVIARKWRPQLFADVVGQQHVTRTLSNAVVSGRVAHAYIFSGARGVGKTTTARILAKALNCANGPAAEPCNQCDSCREISSGSALDVIEIDAASNRGIDQIRELREMVRYAPAGGRYKVVILDEAHMLTTEASNALLKTLEEPPEKVVFVMATTEPESLADTIRSRSQHFHFRALSFAEITDALAKIAGDEGLTAEPGALAVMARAAEGSLRDALSLLEQARAYCGTTLTDLQVRELLGVVPAEVLDELVGAVQAQSAERVLKLVHRLLAEGQNLEHFCREAIGHFRNLLVARVCGAQSDLIAAPADQRPRFELAAAAFGEEDLTRFFQILLRTDDDLRKQPDPRLHLEMGLLRMVNAARLAPLEDVLAELAGAGPAPALQSPSSSSPSSASPSSSRAPSSFSPSTPSSSFSPPTRQAGAPNAAVPGPGLGGAASDITRQRPMATAPSGVPVMPVEAPAPSASFASPAALEEISAPVDFAGSESARPIPATMPSMVARAADLREGLAAAQVEAIKAAILGQEQFLGELIEHASRWEMSGGEVRLFFPTESRALAEMLQSRDPMERLRTITSRILGQSVRVCVKLEAVPAMESAKHLSGSRELRAKFEQDPIVRAMLERFGGQISEVKRRSED